MMARLDEVAVWSFDLAAWGECTQASDEDVAIAAFARRAHVAPPELRVTERITGTAAVFRDDLAPATDAWRSSTRNILSRLHCSSGQATKTWTARTMR